MVHHLVRLLLLKIPCHAPRGIRRCLSPKRHASRFGNDALREHPVRLGRYSTLSHVWLASGLHPSCGRKICKSVLRDDLTGRQTTDRTTSTASIQLAYSLQGVIEVGMQFNTCHSRSSVSMFKDQWFGSWKTCLDTSQSHAASTPSAYQGPQRFSIKSSLLHAVSKTPPTYIRVAS